MQLIASVAVIKVVNGLRPLSTVCPNGIDYDSIVNNNFQHDMITHNFTAGRFTMYIMDPSLDLMQHDIFPDTPRWEHAWDYCVACTWTYNVRNANK